MLRVVNKAQAWFDQRREIVMPDTGEPIPDDVRDLARRIMKHVLKTHRKPSFKGANTVIDRRQATVANEKANRSSQSDFQCRCCSTRMPADVNAARNLGARRSWSVMGNPRRSRRAILDEASRRFGEVPYNLVRLPKLIGGTA